MPQTQQYQAYDAKTGRYWDWDGKQWNLRQPSKGKQVDVGVQQGVAKSFGIKLPNPEDPSTLTFSEMGKQVGRNIKSSAKDSLKAWGPLAPVDMIAKAIE